MEIDHKLQIDYQQTLRTSDTDISIPIITIPIDIGEATFTMFCRLEYRGSVQHSFIHHPSMSTIT
jgi:hypothetical protein